MQDKESIRKSAAAARRKQTDKASTSRRITDRLMASAEYRRAACVLWYVGVRSEVATLQALSVALGEEKRLGIPYCVGNQLALFRLTDLDQLTPGAYQILEPRRELRTLREHQLIPEDLDLVIVPGVAFDERGGRLGHGQGYYDRLLSAVPETTVRAAVAFECQMVRRVPLEAHDVAMDLVVTERRLIRCKERPGLHFGAEPC